MKLLSAWNKINCLMGLTRHHPLEEINLKLNNPFITKPLPKDKQIYRFNLKEKKLWLVVFTSFDRQATFIY